MKKLSLLSFIIISFLFHQKGLSQSFLTNAQVYDYEVGDIIQSRGYTPWNSGWPYTYITKTILNKSVTADQDSIVYTINVDYYSPQACPPPCAPIYSNAVITETITNLNSVALHNNQTSPCMLALIDSIKTDYCNKIVWKKGPGLSLSCTSAPTIEDTYLIEGLGGPYYVFSSKEAAMPLPEYWKHELIYYSKQSGSCGTLVTSINEPANKDFSLSIFPNPFIEKLSIQLNQNITIQETQIFDINTKSVLNTKESNNINVSSLVKGIYFIKIKTDKGEYSQKFIKE